MATIKFRQRTRFRGPVDFGSAGDAQDFTFYGDTAGATMLWDGSADTLALTDSALSVDNDTTTPALDITGWSNLGYVTTDPSGAVTAGLVRMVKANSRYWLAMAVGSSTFRYAELSGTSTA